jgi:acyl dehydratase
MHKLIDRDVRIGTELPPVSKQFNVDMFKLGNVRTLHNDQAAAELEGLPRPIAVAPQVSALIFRMMRMMFGDGWIVGGKGSLTFRRPVWANDFATARGIVTQASPEGEKTRVHCDVWVERADGEHAIVGTCSALV